MALAITFALLCYFFWAFGDSINAVVARQLDAYSLTFYGMIISVIVFAFYAPWQIDKLNNLNAEILLLNIFLGILLIIGLIAFNKALSISNPTVVGSISSSFIALTVIFSLLFLGEKITGYQALAIIIILIGLAVTSVNRKVIEKFSWDLGILLAFIAMVLWALYFTFIKIPVQSIGWFWPNFFTFCLFPILFIYLKLTKKKLQPIKTHGTFWLLVISVILVRMAEMSFNFAISKGLTSIVAPIAGSYITLFVVLTAIIFKDPFRGHQKIGIAITLIGIVALSLVTPY